VEEVMGRLYYALGQVQVNPDRYPLLEQPTADAKALKPRLQSDFIAARDSIITAKKNKITGMYHELFSPMYTPLPGRSVLLSRQDQYWENR